MNDEAGVVMISAPSPAGESLARILVERRAAACVQIVPRVLSVYRWEGAVQTGEEVLLVVKTMRSKLGDIRAILKESHPYELPELVFLPVTDGLEGYLAWIRSSVA